MSGNSRWRQSLFVGEGRWRSIAAVVCLIVAALTCPRIALRADDGNVRTSLDSADTTLEESPPAPAPPEYDEPPLFFLRDDAQPAASDETGTGAPTTAPGGATEFFMVDPVPSPRPIAERVVSTVVNEPAPAAPVPREMPPRGVANHLRSCLEDCCCAWQERWVNWRWGSDYLEGCIPEGYNALPVIRTRPSSMRYSSPLHGNGPVEPGGGADGTLTGGPLRVPMTRLTTNIAPPGMPPAGLEDSNPVRTHLPGTHRNWNGMVYYWDASQLMHQPLYFEDVNLERHGYSYGIAQPFVSAARFFVRFPLLPYALTVHPHQESVYTLGESRPGSPTPFVHEQPTPDPWAAAVEGGVVTGLFFLLP